MATATLRVSTSTTGCKATCVAKYGTGTIEANLSTSTSGSAASKSVAVPNTFGLTINGESKTGYDWQASLTLTYGTGGYYNTSANKNTALTYSGNAKSGDLLSGYVSYTAKSYPVSTGVSPSGAGSVSGGGTYAYGKTVNLVASPAAGYHFTRWSDGYTYASRTIAVSTVNNYTAYFEKDIYTVYFDTNGSITPSFSKQVAYGDTVGDVQDPVPPTNPDKSITITFDSNGGNEGQEYVPLVCPSATVFAGWDKSLSTAITSNTTFTAEYSTSYAAQIPNLPSSTPTRAGYIFDYGKDSAGSNIGSVPGTPAAKGYTSNMTVYAQGRPEDRHYTVRYKALVDGQEIDIAPDGTSFKEFTVKFNETKTFDNIIPTFIGLVLDKKKVYYLDSSGNQIYVSDFKGELAESLGTYYAVFIPTTGVATLKLEGGIYNNSNTDIQIKYTILDDKIDLWKYEPAKTDTVFIGGVPTDATGTYEEEINPKEPKGQKNRVLKAEYRNLGKFVYTDKGGRPVLNTGIYDGKDWSHCEDKEKRAAGDKIYTTPIAYVYGDDGNWHIERGKENTILD